ncbi:hypothetical protein EHS25_008934 [Saitozyma podzolica]|uniref:Uncharacterized protein n=1 Tax=Saitozyma podzolica TaxID=1890683 RepID=A0A427YN09_9TREE|nr:hypothetical protein EHS25_008934 [Saitozyma podzolica]
MTWIKGLDFATGTIGILPRSSQTHTFSPSLVSYSIASYHIPSTSLRSYMTAPAATSHPPQPTPRLQPPQPGDGAFLAASIPVPPPRPGDGAYLANGHDHGDPSRRAGRGGGQRGRRGGGRPGGDNAVRPQRAPVADGLSQHGDVSTSTSQEATGKPSDRTGNRPPRQRRQPRADAAVRAAAAVPNGHSAQRSNAPLDPSAPSFAPPTAQLASLSVEPQHLVPVAASSSRASSDVQGPKRERSETGGRRAGRGDRNARGGRGGNTSLSEIQVHSEPTAKLGISSRRAAFEQQSKLTTTVSRTSDGSSGAARRLSVDQEQVKEYRAKHRKREKEAEKDDLISRLTRGLGRKPFLECPIVCPSLQAVSDELSNASTRFSHHNPSGPVFPQLHRPKATHRPTTTPRATPPSISTACATGRIETSSRKPKDYGRRARRTLRNGGAQGVRNGGRIRSGDTSVSVEGCPSRQPPRPPRIRVESRVRENAQVATTRAHCRAIPDPAPHARLHSSYPARTIPVSFCATLANARRVRRLRRFDATAARKVKRCLVDGAGRMSANVPASQKMAYRSTGRVDTLAAGRVRPGTIVGSTSAKSSPATRTLCAQFRARPPLCRSSLVPAALRFSPSYPDIPDPTAPPPSRHAVRDAPRSALVVISVLGHAMKAPARLVTRKSLDLADAGRQ